MPIPKKGTPEYEVWKNSPMYEDYRKRSSSVSKGKWDDPEYRQAMLIKRKEDGIRRRGQKQSTNFFSLVSKSDQNECWLWIGPRKPDGRCIYYAKSKELIACRWSYEYHKGPIPNGGKISRFCKNALCVNPDHLGLVGEDIHHSFTLETRNKISESLSRKKGTPEGDAWREKNAKSAYRIPGTPEYDAWKQNISNAQKGKKLSPEHAKKVAVARLGSTYTDEAKADLSIVRKLRWQSLSEEKKRDQVDNLTRNSGHITNSWIERYYAQRLDTQGIAYERQKSIGWYRVDFYIESENRIVELNGCYWHDCDQCGHAEKHPGKQDKDRKRYEYLRRKGYTVEVVWEHDLPQNPRR